MYVECRLGGPRLKWRTLQPFHPATDFNFLLSEYEILKCVGGLTFPHWEGTTPAPEGPFRALNLSKCHAPLDWLAIHRLSNPLQP